MGPTSSNAARDGEVIVVSGLPRSGTSLMMRMLEAGGLSPVTDGERRADDDNPRGYYELERVKQLPQGDHGWLDHAHGKVVKIISALLVHLPPTHRYKVVFMRRALPEVLASQRKMLVNREEDPDRTSEEKLTRLFTKHLADTEAWMNAAPTVDYRYVSFNELVADPVPHVDRIREFLGPRLDAAAMCRVVEPSLYRQRA